MFLLFNDKNELYYHGDEIKAPYFEGWYYKVTTDTFALALIVGISKNKLEEHVFIQTIDTITKKTTYHRFAMSEVQIEEDPFLIRIQENIFRKSRLQIQLPNLQLDLSMSDFTELKKSMYAPTIMGPFSYYKAMQCVHSILSLQHTVKGMLTCLNQQLPISGVGYMEKDRGVSFPKEYIWAQSNACDIEDCCFFLSIAHIPFLKTSFTGCICVLMIHRKQYHFATYYGVRIQQMKTDQVHDYKKVSLTLVQYPYRLNITIKQVHAYPLIAPADGIMEPKVFESLDSEIEVQLFHHQVEITSLQFIQAGCEIRL